jgi:uncharacterized protein YbjT (DUF2867 family)
MFQGSVPIPARNHSISASVVKANWQSGEPSPIRCIRPAVMFGPDDAFLTTVIKLLKLLPIYPMFGRGRTRLQPVYVEDVAKAAAMALQPTLARPLTFECGGPHVYSYEELLRAVAHEVNVRPMLVPIPFAAWRALASIAEFLPRPPITRNQVELMQVDNVSSPQMPGLADLVFRRTRSRFFCKC